MLGRFTQEDTYREDGRNLYAYCGNNPVRYHDSSGHDGKEYLENPSTENGQSRVEQVDEEVGNVAGGMEYEGSATSTVIDYSYKFDKELLNLYDGYEVKHVIEKDMILVQYSSDAPLCYWTTVDEANSITTLDECMDRLALSKDWGNRNTIKVARIKAGTEVTYDIGTAKEQLQISDPRPGGGIQLLFYEFNTNWITEIRGF